MRKRHLTGLILLLAFLPACALAVDGGETYPVQLLLPDSEAGDYASDPLDRRVSLGENAAEGLELTAPNEDIKKTVTTCRAYKGALAEGWFALTTFDMTMESFFIRQCGWLDIRQNARPSEASFFGEDFPQPADIITLPKDMIDVFAIGDPFECTGLTLEGCLQKYQATFELNEDGQILYDDAGITGRFTPALRGDINNDGFEDMVLNYAAHAKGGSLRYYDYFCLTRTDALVTSPITCTIDSKKE